MGSPRSGTSITAGICQKLGLNIGQDFQQSDTFNETGYFSDYVFNFIPGAFIDCSKLIPQKVPISEIDQIHIDYFLDKLQYKHFLNHPNDWGFKNNYTSYVIDLFLKYSSVEVHGIITHRPAEESIKSYTKYKNFGEDWSRRHITSHIMSLNEADKQIIDAGGKVLHVDYHELVKDPEKTTKQLSEFLSLPWTKEASDMVNSSLKHF